jgi:hypothetical protein
MRFLLLLAAAGLAAAPSLADARGLQRDRGQNATYRAMQEGRILSLPEIRARVRVPGAEYIGAEMLAPGVYRLKYMRGAEVIWIDVDARTGRIIGRQ